MLGNSLYGVVKLTKNADSDKYGYNDYGIGFHQRSEFLWTHGNWAKNVIILGVDNSSSAHLDNKNTMY